MHLSEGVIVDVPCKPTRSIRRNGIQGGDTNGEVARALMEDVHDAVCDLVELIKTYQSKNRLSKVLMSTLFNKRRQDELDAVVDRANLRLHVRVVCFLNLVILL